MEAQIDLFENGLPSEDVVVEIVNSDGELSFEDVFFEGVGLGQIQVVHADLENGDEDVPATVDEVKRQGVYLQL